MEPLIHPSLKINFDFSTFHVVQNKEGEHQLVYEDGSEDSKKNKVLEGLESACTIKYLLMISASGVAADPVLIIQDKEMGAEEIRIAEIPRLTHAAISGQKGTICCMKSRAGNKAFFEHLYTVLIPKFVNQLRKDGNLYEADGTPMLAEVSQDGEALALNGALSQACRAAMLTNCIEVLKFCASCSAIHQPCDVGKIFLSMKTILRHMDEETDIRSIDAQYPGLKAFIDAQPGIKEYGTKALLAALPLIIQAMQRSVNSTNIINSFKYAGIVPFSPEQMYAQSAAVISDEQKKIIKDSLESLGKLYVEHGSITDQNMRDARIEVPKDNREVDKDQRALQNQRIASLTNDGTLLRQLEKLEAAEALKAVNSLKKAEALEVAIAAACDLTRKYNTAIVRNFTEAQFFSGNTLAQLKLALKGLYSVMEKAVRPNVPTKLSDVQSSISQFYNATEGILHVAREKFRESYRDRYA